MKKKMLASLLLSVIVLSIGAQAASAENLESSKTTGEVGFKAGEKPGTTKPEKGPKDGEDLEDDKDDKGNPIPLPNNNGIYVTHLPNFSFGKDNKTSVKTVDYEAYTEERKLKGTEDVFYMPHSVQVSDVSGNEQATWKLSVVQDNPFEAGSSVLENTRIRIYGNTFTNSLKNTQELGDNIKGVEVGVGEENGPAKHATIPLTGKNEGELTVLSNTKPGFTNASTTSAVFINDYKEDAYSKEKTPETAAYEGVKLNVPASDQAKAKTYTTKLTWTLTVEPGTPETPETAE
ncbi:hypothetical protein DOK67_0001499 [Enterococcus sp. DIV0212c]|uniref:WxL domain-containing protein n=1 Tax=Enterococcus sp. DIV0212c TaxID=2230867 RepID=UPI001A9ABBC7|nr:WxL domain-containing protein [Enterococcus sp. DIV0212c]MBO1354294.1 WxL domain-containing protein [Enterococcus sp. DIV0212c]